jgi:Carboxypeptidase regulatory-like domain
VRLPLSAILLLIAIPGIPTRMIAMPPAQKSHTFETTVRVSDTSGAYIPDANVLFAPLAADSSATPGSASFKTDHKGTVTAQLKPGTYTVSASAPGFKETRYQQVRLDKSLSLAITLQVATYSGPIIVNPVYPLVPVSRPLQELIPEIPYQLARRQ